MPIEKPPKEVEKNVRKTIRRKIGKGALKPPAENDLEKLVLQQASRILRDEGLKDIVIPFDAKEPKGSGRRATAQFGRLIIVSAYLHQYQRPILHIGDKKFVLDIHEDLENALGILAGLGVGNLLKIAPKSIDLLKLLPSQEPNLDGGVKSEIVMTSQKLHNLAGIPERTINDHLADLYEAGLVSRKKMKAPGSPYAYWTDPEISAIVSGKDGKASLSSSEQESCLLNCDGKYSLDSLKGSISAFFKELSEIEEDTTVYLGILSNEEFDMSPEEYYLKAWGTKLKIDAEHNISIWGDVSSASKAGSDAPSMGNVA